MWSDFRSRFEHILSRLRRHRELIERQAALQNSQEIQRNVERYQQDRDTFVKFFEKQERAESEKTFFGVLKWISGVQTSLDHEAFCSERVEDTGRWILKHEKVENWKEAETPENSILWLNGIPGAGTISPLGFLKLWCRIVAGCNVSVSNER